MRNAIVAAIDYDAIAKILYVNDEVAGGVPSKGPIPPGMLGYDESRPYFKQDLELAKKELALSGYDASTAPVIELTALTCCATHQKMAYVTQTSLEAIGINTKIVDTEWVDQIADFVKPARNTSPSVFSDIENAPSSAKGASCLVKISIPFLSYFETKVS